MSLLEGGTLTDTTGGYLSLLEVPLLDYRGVFVTVRGTFTDTIGGIYHCYRVTFTGLTHQSTLYFMLFSTSRRDPTANTRSVISGYNSREWDSSL